MSSTCLCCARAKVRCDKQSPCLRCVRLGLECTAQTRGRGRPRKHQPSGSSSCSSSPEEQTRSLPTVTKQRPQRRAAMQQKKVEPKPEEPLEAPLLAQPQPIKQEEEMKQPLPPASSFDFFDSPTMPLTPVELRSPRLLPYIESQVLRLRGTERTKELTEKIHAVMRWQLLNAAHATDELTYDKLLQLGEVVELKEGSVPTFEAPPMAVLHPSDPPLPAFIRGMHSESSAVLTRLTMHGVTRFYTNQEFNNWFFPSDTANNMFSSNGQDEEEIMGSIVTPEALHLYLQCMADLLISKPGLETEGSVVVPCRFNDQNMRTCLIQMRTFTDPAGNINSSACRVFPLPASDYVLGAPVPPPLTNPVPEEEAVATTSSRKRTLDDAPSSSQKRQRSRDDPILDVWLSVDQPAHPPQPSDVLELDVLDFAQVFSEDFSEVMCQACV